jgi:predicted metal-dependent hydrolase
MRTVLLQADARVMALPSAPIPTAGQPAPVQLGLFDAAPVGPVPPPAPPVAVATPLAWVHPRANRDCRLEGLHVAYEFKRAKRRTVGLTVGPQGLSVRAPTWVPLAEVERFLHSKSAWVLDKWRRWQDAQRNAPAPTAWHEGMALAWLGQTLTVRLDPGHAFEGAGAGVRDGSLVVALPHGVPPERLREAIQAWMRRESERHLRQRLDHFAPIVGVHYTRLRLSNADTRWGSAKVDGSIRLHWRLAQLAPELIDYVVVHELSHLREMNHSPAFWHVVESVLPGYEVLRQQLKRVRLPSD